MLGHRLPIICRSYSRWITGFPSSMTAVPVPSYNDRVTRACRHRFLSSFSFTGPRTLNDIVKKDLLDDKSRDEISHIWKQYHQDKEGIQGLVFNGESGTKILAQAADCPFFVQPVFRDGGYFVLLSQFQDPRHFLLGYLEDYKQDPASAPPLMTISLFDDYSSSKDLTLIRCDVVNKSLQATTNNPKQEARQIAQHLLDNYLAEDDVRAFNKTPGSFDYDDYIARQSQKWKDYKDPSLVDGEAN